METLFILPKLKGCAISPLLPSLPQLTVPCFFFTSSPSVPVLFSPALSRFGSVCALYLHSFISLPCLKSLFLLCLFFLSFFSLCFCWQQKKKEKNKSARMLSAAARHASRCRSAMAFCSRARRSLRRCCFERRARSPWTTRMVTRMPPRRPPRRLQGASTAPAAAGGAGRSRAA